MFDVFKNAFKNPDLKKKILYTLFIIVIFRFGSAIVAPFVDNTALKELVTGSDSFFGLLNAFSGGAFGQATVFAMSISPYITASIIVQLLTVAIPALERLAKEGEHGKKVLNKITKYVTIGMATLQAVAYYLLLKNNNGIIDEFSQGFGKYFAATTIIMTMIAGTSLVMWLADRISEKGLGNGTSMILFAGIISNAPSAISVLWELFMQGGINYLLIPLVFVIFAAVIVFIIIMTTAERRIPVNYAKRVVGRKVYGGQSSHIPIKVAMSGVIPIIFAMSILAIPSTIAAFVAPQQGSFWASLLSIFSPSSWVYGVVYLLLIIAFSYFYVAIQYNPIEIANNLKNNNGAIAGIRPGKPTSVFLQKVISKITFIGAIFLGVIAVFPILFTTVSGINISLGGTSIIIVVGVALDTMRQLESQLTMRHYKGFLE